VDSLSGNLRSAPVAEVVGSDQQGDRSRPLLIEIPMIHAP
jgi:hypothetical protein